MIKDSELVAVGVLEKDGKFLISQRKPPSDMPGYWEFGGGKVEVDETSEQAVVREFAEEYGVFVRVKSFLGSFSKPEQGLEFDVFLLNLDGPGSPRPFVAKQLRWVSMAELRAMRKLLPAMPKILDMVENYQAGRSPASVPPEKCVVPRTTGQPAYEQLVNYLNTHQRKLIPSSYYRQECDPPDDPKWPAPKTPEEVQELLARLPVRSQQICILIAAELALPVWEDAREDPAPRLTIEATKAYLAGEIDDQSLEEVRTRSSEVGADELRPTSLITYVTTVLTDVAWAAAGAASMALHPEHIDDGYGVVAYAAAAFMGALKIPPEDFFELWWKECRCRLALDEPEAQELTTKGAEAYEGLKRYLEAPKSEVYVPPPSAIRKCDIPEDSRWPTPFSKEEVENLIRRLPNVQQIMCALINAELILQIWEAHADIDRDINLYLRRAVDTIWQWLRGNANIVEVREVEEDVWGLSWGALDISASVIKAVAWSISSAAQIEWGAAVATSGGVSRSAKIVSQAGWMSEEEYYTLWWQECRCRLAAGNLEELELTTGQPSYDELKERLASPIPKVIPAELYHRELSPCNPPDDPDWPTPQTVTQILKYLGRLPRAGLLACLLPVMERLVALWGSGPAGLVIPSGTSGPVEAINIVKEWMAGQASTERVRVAGAHVREVASLILEVAGETEWPVYHPIALAVSYFTWIVLASDANVDLAAYDALDTAFLAIREQSNMSAMEFIDWWWKECRCKLAIDRPEAQELTTKGAEDYEGLKRYLESPERETYISSLLTRRECDPKEDPEWPTPTNGEEAEELLKRLPHRSQVICALTAAELVLPIWEDQWEPGDSNIDLRPREAIETTWRWLNGEATLEEVSEAEEAGWAAEAAAGWAAAGPAGEAAARAAARAAWWAAARAAWWAAARAARAAYEAGWMSQEEFYDLWWKECRCRLAIAKPESTELTTKGVHNYEGLKRYLESPERREYEFEELQAFAGKPMEHIGPLVVSGNPPQKYQHINFKPPKGAAEAAKRGLKLREKYKRGGLTTKEAHKEGIGSGVQRATNLANRDQLDPSTVRRMKAFFDRHKAFKKHHKKSPPSNAKISWLLWGGDAGYRWAKKIVAQMEKADQA